MECGCYDNHVPDAICGCVCHGRLRSRRSRDPSTYGKLSAKSDVMGGALCIAGTRIPVNMLTDWIEAGIDDAEILRELPSLVPVDLGAVLTYRDRGWCERIRMVEPGEGEGSGVPWVLGVK